jgi:hypothetical protein
MDNNCVKVLQVDLGVLAGLDSSLLSLGTQGFRPTSPSSVVWLGSEFARLRVISYDLYSCHGLRWVPPAHGGPKSEGCVESEGFRGKVLNVAGLLS